MWKNTEHDENVEVVLKMENTLQNDLKDNEQKLEY